MVTHNVVEAEQALDRVAIIKEGKILSEGTPNELKAQIDNQIRVEVELKENADISHILENVPDLYIVGKNRYILILEKELAEDDISYMIKQFNYFEDFRMVTPSLEDVYLKLSGGEMLGDK